MEGARTLAGALAAHGHRLLEAPVSGSLSAVLAALGSVVPLLGPVGQGALAKLLVNSLLGVQVSLLAEWIGTLRRQGADPERLLQAAAATPAWSPIAGRLSASMLAGDFQPQFPVELIAKDFGYTLQLYR